MTSFQHLPGLVHDQVWWLAWRILGDASQAAVALERAEQQHVWSSAAMHIRHDRETGLYDVLVTVD